MPQPPVAPAPVYPAPAPPAYAPSPGYAPQGYAAPPYAPAPGAASPMVMNIVGFVFVILGVVASVIAFFLSEDQAYEWSAGIYLLAAIFWVIALVFFFMGRRHAPAYPPAGMYPPR